MARTLHKKSESGIATTYISRRQALRKLQLSLKDFRRLCILKGIYPVEPPNKRKANKNSSTNKAYFYLKDIQFLSHEPLIDKFRAFKVFMKRLRRYIGKHDQETSRRLREREPTYTLNHIVKERYPTFIDALRDIDDAISMCFLFSTFPKSRVIKAELSHLCRRLTVEFLHYVIETKSLRKVFISIKGIYYQAEIMGQLVTWIVPHILGYHMPSDVDFKIMVTFAQFYSTMLGFVNYKLYHSINLIYPPKLEITNESDKELLQDEDEPVELLAALTIKLQSSVRNTEDEEQKVDKFPEEEDSEEIKNQKLHEEQIEKLKNLFSGCKIFLNREVPRESLVFIIRCFGGEVSFDKTLAAGASFDETDLSITHQIVDRPKLSTHYINRHYVQPQWVFDSVNARMLLPVDLYFPGEILPPHLSPFVEEKEGDYIPPEKQALIDMQKGVTKGLRRPEESSDDEISDSDTSVKEKDDGAVNDNAGGVDETSKKRKMLKDEAKTKRIKTEVSPGVLLKKDAAKQAQKEAAEEKKLAIMMMHKKDKHLYNKIIFGQKRKNREVQKLKEKRKEFEKQQKKRKQQIKRNQPAFKNC